jgi:hypothetical protein
MYGHSDFYRMVTGAFPELQAELDEDPELLHVQMGAFAGFTEQAKGRGDWSTYQRCIALANALWLTPDAALLNALNVSYLEHLNFTGPRGDIAWGHMTPSLRIAWQQMQAYMRGLQGR